jgi:outer membrane protein insertion porin family
MGLRTALARRYLAAGIVVGIALLPWGPRLAAAQSPAASIAVEGNRRVEADTIRGYFKPRSGEPLDAAAVDAGIKALYASGLFNDVKITRSADGLTVTVVEAPIIDRVQLEGNRSLKDKQLTGELQSKPRGPLIAATVQADVVRIVDLYKHSGRYDVRVVPKTIARTADRVDLVFEIAEGEKTTVRRIDFVGDRAFAASRLKGVIKTGVTNVLSFLTGSDLYDADRIEADCDLLRRFYLAHGYADVRVAAARAELDPAQKGIVVTFTIEEGEPYRFGAIDIQSRVAQIDGPSLAGELKVRAGDTYNAAAIDKTVDDLTIGLARRGFPFGAVRARSAPNPDRKTVDLVFTVEEGARTYVERINIRGNLRTRDYVIRREFDIVEGDAFNRALIDRAERRLKALAYFKTVKIVTEPGSTPDRVVVDVDLEEQETGDLTFGIGYSTVDGVVGNVSVGDRNFLGSGQNAHLSLNLGQYASSFDVGLVTPYFLGTPMSFGVDLFGKTTAANSYQSYGTDKYGIGFQLGMPVTEEVSAALRYSLYNENVTIDPTAVAGTVSLPVQQAAQMGSSWVSMVGYTLSYDTRDDRKNPTDGVRAEFRQDLAGVGGDVNFLKTAEDVRAYHEITNDVVGMARVQSGYLMPWGGQDVPLIDRFFGGPQLVRGFAPNGFGPRDLTPGSTMDNIGGTLFWGTTAEAQTAIPYLPSDFGLKFAVFADAGSVWASGSQANIPALSQSFVLGNSTTIRSSFGAGLIWGSPFGPIRVDYAVPVTKTSYDMTQRLGFSFGGF